MNGFFMSMRSNFVAPGASIYYFVVEWDKDTCAWEDFRGKVLGPTDPATAPKGSLRKAIYEGWKKLELTAAPNVSDNGVHASGDFRPDRHTRTPRARHDLRDAPERLALLERRLCAPLGRAGGGWLAPHAHRRHDARRRALDRAAVHGGARGVRGAAQIRGGGGRQLSTGAALLYWRHQENIGRILKGEEPKIGAKKT